MLRPKRASSARGAVARLEGAAQIAAGGLDGGDDADHQAGAERNREGEQGDPQIDADLGHTRQSRRRAGRDRIDQRSRDDKAQRAAGETEHGGFAKNVSDDAAA